MQMDPEACYGKAEALRARRCPPAEGAGAAAAAAAAAAAEAHVDKHKQKTSVKENASWFANVRRVDIWSVQVSICFMSTNELGDERAWGKEQRRLGEQPKPWGKTCAFSPWNWQEVSRSHVNDQPPPLPPN